MLTPKRTFRRMESYSRQAHAQGSAHPVSTTILCRDLRIGKRYSARNVAAGSICATRSAGTKLAVTAMTAKSNGRQRGLMDRTSEHHTIGFARRARRRTPAPFRRTYQRRQQLCQRGRYAALQGLVALPGLIEDQFHASAAPQGSTLVRTYCQGKAWVSAQLAQSKSKILSPSAHRIAPLVAYEPSHSGLCNRDATVARI